MKTDDKSQDTQKAQSLVAATQGEVAEITTLKKTRFFPEVNACDHFIDCGSQVSGSLGGWFDLSRYEGNVSTHTHK